MRIVPSNPASEPLTYADVKLNCRVDTDEEQSLFESWITSAREYCEPYISQFFITRTVDIYLDRWPTTRNNWPYFYYLTGATHYTHYTPSEDYQHNVIRIPYGPLQSIESIKYIDPSGVEQTWVEGTDFYVSTGKLPRIQAITGFPETKHKIDCIHISATFGYGDASTDVPACVIQAMHLFVAECYRQRAQSTDLPLKTIPIDICNLLSKVSGGAEYVF